MPFTDVKTFQIGDRVCLTPRAQKRGGAALFQRTHGAIVFYHGAHLAREPRVRWADGWGTSVPASQLRRLTAVECRHWPAPKLISGDLGFNPKTEAF